MFLPIGILSLGVLFATTFYNRYQNRISSSWRLLPRVELTAISSASILEAISSKVDGSNLPQDETSKLASTLSSWIESQHAGTVDSFMAFRNRGLERGDVRVSEVLAHYYQQFLNINENEPLQQPQPQPGTDIISAIYKAHASEGGLDFRGKRLCLGCVKSVSLNSLELKIANGTDNPLNEFMNGDDHLSLESFTGVFEAIGEFRHHLSGLTSRSKTANVSFVIESGDGPRRAYKCGMQLIWLPTRKSWFPIELMIGYPGSQMPMEAFLF